MIKQINNAIYGRWYDVDGIKVPSVSTITQWGCPMSFGLLEFICKEAIKLGSWEEYQRGEFSEALRVGTDVHNYAEQILNGEEVIIENDKEVQKALTSLMFFLKRHKPRPVAIEKVLFCTKMKQGRLILPFAGRCDMVADINNELWMLDFKTSKSLDVHRYPIQLTMYASLWNATQDRMIDRLGVVHLKKSYRGAEPSKNTKFLHEYNFNMESVKCALHFFHNFYSSTDKDGSPKLKPNLHTEFKLGGKNER